jgi:hypothetical protein
VPPRKWHLGWVWKKIKKPSRQGGEGHSWLRQWLIQGHDYQGHTWELGCIAGMRNHCLFFFFGPQWWQVTRSERRAQASCWLYALQSMLKCLLSCPPSQAQHWVAMTTCADQDDKLNRLSRRDRSKLKKKSQPDSWHLGEFGTSCQLPRVEVHTPSASLNRRTSRCFPGPQSVWEKLGSRCFIQRHLVSLAFPGPWVLSSWLH